MFLGSTMSVWTTSLVNTQEVINMLLDKYRVECPASSFSLFVVKDNGGKNNFKKLDCCISYYLRRFETKYQQNEED